jgi:hypothetical protein
MKSPATRIGFCHAKAANYGAPAHASASGFEDPFYEGQ